MEKKKNYPWSAKEISSLGMLVEESYRTKNNGSIRKFMEDKLFSFYSRATKEAEDRTLELLEEQKHLAFVAEQKYLKTLEPDFGELKQLKENLTNLPIYSITSPKKGYIQQGLDPEGDYILSSDLHEILSFDEKGLEEENEENPEPPQSKE